MRAAIIGAGRMGRRYIQIIQKSRLQLTGVADLMTEALKLCQLENSLSDDLLFANLESLFLVAKPEVLIIATTADSHCSLTCMAAKLGVKYILVEKPLAVSLGECEMMINVCENYGAQLSVNHQMRFMDQYIKPKALLNSDAYGGFKSMTIVGGNCGVSMNGTHYIEAFRFMSNEDPLEVTAWFDPGIVANPRGARFVDKAGSMRVTTVSGKCLYMQIGSNQGHGLEVVYAGRNGLITVDELSGKMVSKVRRTEFKDLPTTRYGMPADITNEMISPVEVIDSTALVLSALLNDNNRVTAENGMSAVKVLVAAYMSAENNSRPVLIDNLLDHNRAFPWA